jgi:hypothetical protein
VGPCRADGASGARDARIDLVEARGEIVETGLALRFTLVFADRLPVPDRERTPLRVDVVLADPTVPTVSFGPYREVNRIVRFDAVPDPLLQIVLLPERGANVFVGAVALGNTLTMNLPGRLVTRDRDLEGLGLDRIRWSVIVRDERDCDLLGDGRPTQRLVVSPPTPSTTPSETGPPGSPDSVTADGLTAWVAWAVVLVPIAVLWGYAWFLRRRARGSSPAPPAR